MAWEILKKGDIAVWNEKLKQTNAPFYQYPYCISAEYSSPFSNVIFLTYNVNEKIAAFVSVLEIGTLRFKIAVIDGGPVLLTSDIDIQTMVADLKTFAEKKHYIHLQIRPAGERVENILKNDNAFVTEILFPFHMKEEYDWNIYNTSEENLLAGFKLQGRRKIVLAGRVPYEFEKIKNENDLKEIRKLFNEVSKTKGYKFLPFKIFEKIFKEGKRYNLSDIYVARLNNEIVNAAIIVKDAHSFYHLTSGLLIKGFKYNESPSAKLHFFIMQDCFYAENKKYYNISFGGSDNLIRFKELFNPVEIERPHYYTYVINKKAISFLTKISPSRTTSLRAAYNRIKKMMHF